MGGEGVTGERACRLDCPSCSYSCILRSSLVLYSYGYDTVLVRYRTMLIQVLRSRDRVAQHSTAGRDRRRFKQQARKKKKAHETKITLCHYLGSPRIAVQIRTALECSSMVSCVNRILRFSPVYGNTDRVP